LDSPPVLVIRSPRRLADVAGGVNAFTAAQRAAFVLSVAATVTASGALVPGKHNPVDASGGAKTMTLPTGQAEGATIGVEKLDSSANAVTVTGSVRGTAGQSISLPWAHETRTASPRRRGRRR
jgi:hypothetical protein